MEELIKVLAQAVTKVRRKVTMGRAISRPAQAGTPHHEKAIIETITGRIATARAIIMAQTLVSDINWKQSREFEFDCVCCEKDKAEITIETAEAVEAAPTMLTRAMITSAEVKVLMANSRLRPSRGASREKTIRSTSLSKVKSRAASLSTSKSGSD